MRYSYEPFGKRTRDREAEHAASEDTQDGACPADEESSSQFIPTHKDQHLMVIPLNWLSHIKSTLALQSFLLLCHKHWVVKLGCYPVCVEGAR